MTRRLWDELLPLISAHGLEAALLEKKPTQTLETLIVAKTSELIATKEKTIIQEVFEKTRTLRFTRLLAHVLKPSSGIPIVTTNYDRLVEIAVEEAGLGVDTMFIGQFAGMLNEKESRMSLCRQATLKDRRAQLQYRPFASIYKPHGSLDWYFREGKPVRYAGDLELPKLIITPGINKFRNDYDSPFDRHRERANVAIEQASRFVILGYGFNDDHLETHLTPRIRSGVPTLLLTHTLSENALKLIASCDKVMAVQYKNEDGNEGSSVWINGSEIFIPDINLWDLDGFITEVLEP